MEMGTLYIAFRNEGIYEGHAEIVGLPETGLAWTNEALVSFDCPTVVTSTRSAVLVHLMQSSVVKLTIYDVGGRLCGELFHGTLGAGDHNLPIRLRGASGTYFIRLEAGSVTETRRVVLVR